MAKTIDLVMGLKDQVSPGLGKINSNLQTTSGKLNAMGKSVLKLGNIMKGVFIGGAIAGFATEAMKAYDTQIQAEKSVTRAIQATGKTADIAKSELQEWKDFASKQQDITAFGDESTLKNISGLISQGFGKKDIKDIVAMSQDIARSTGDEQESVTKALAAYVKTGKGATKLAKAYKLNNDLLGKGKTESERLAEVWKAFSESEHKGASTEYLKTFEGQLESLKGRLADLNEPLGQLFESLLGYDHQDGATAISVLDQAIKDATTDIQELADRSSELGGGISGVGKAAFEAYPGVTTFLAACAAGKTIVAIGELATAITAVGKAIGATAGIVGAVSGSVVAFIGTLAASVYQMKEWVKQSQEVRNELDRQDAQRFGFNGSEAGYYKSQGINFDLSGSIGSTKGKANGTGYFEGGRTIVGEYGPEIVDLPRGSVVKNNAQTRRELSGGGPTINCPITVQGNVIGNDDFIEQLGTAITGKVQLAIANM